MARNVWARTRSYSPRLHDDWGHQEKRGEAAEGGLYRKNSCAVSVCSSKRGVLLQTPSHSVQFTRHRQTCAALINKITLRGSKQPKQSAWATCTVYTLVRAFPLSANGNHCQAPTPERPKRLHAANLRDVRCCSPSQPCMAILDCVILKMLSRGSTRAAPLRLSALRLSALRPLSTKATGAGAKAGEKTSFGREVAGDSDSAAQHLHDINKGRWEYLSDFTKSMDKGPVKLQFGEAERSAEQKAQDEAAEKALTMIQRSLWVGSLLAVAGCAAAWQITKRWLGVSNVAEFKEAMGSKMPKVSGSMEDSMVGRKMKEKAVESRDAISEDPELTAWRRSLRDKFNTPEGAAIARQNSVLMAQAREKERLVRKGRSEGGPEGGPPPERRANLVRQLSARAGSAPPPTRSGAAAAAAPPPPKPAAEEGAAAPAAAEPAPKPTPAAVAEFKFPSGAKPPGAS